MSARARQYASRSLLKWHDEGQLPFEPLLRHQPHDDALVRDCEQWLKNHFREPGAVAGVVDHAWVPERTLKRRFKAATGLAIIDYVQNLRIEEAKRLLESSDEAADEIGCAVGYEDPSFFRRLFKRRTGVTPGRYRRAFQPHPPRHADYRDTPALDRLAAVEDLIRLTRPVRSSIL